MSATSHLRALQALELAIRTGSLKAAAKALALTPAAVGQRIRSLEDYLGFPLLVRSRHGIRPAPETLPAVAHLSAAFRELDTVARLLDFQRVDEIHIAADSDWASLWLQPRLTAFRKNNPNASFCINGVGDVPARLGDADCSIVFTDAAEPGQDVLFRDYLQPITSPTNRDRIANRPSADMLEGFPLLHLDSYQVEASDVGWQDWIERFGHRREPPGHGIRYKKLVQALEAVYADAGFVICGVALAKDGLDNGQLATAFPDAEGLWSQNTYRARFRPASLGRGAVANFREWLLAEAGRTRGELAARAVTRPGDTSSK